MPLTLEQGKELLKKTIQKDLKHIDYDRVCKIAKEYKAYITGEDIEGLLRQFTPRESKELFDQRVAITSLTTPDIANTLLTPMYKVGRTTANSSITWKNTDKNTKNRESLMQAADKFWGDASVEKYLTYRMPALDSTDPNSFIVVEFDGEVDPADRSTKAKPYPFEVNSQEAIDYMFSNNILQYLTVLTNNEKKFTMYLENESIVAIEFKKEDLSEIQRLYPKAEIWYKDEADEKRDSTKMYYVIVYEHKAGMMPARRVGTKLDEETRGRTCVPMIHPAKCYFEKAIKTVSEFDLTNALHTFPKVFRYGNRCPGDWKKGIVCDEGKYVNHELANQENGGVLSNCPVCKGSGWSNQTTTASEVIVAAPKEMKDMVSLDMMMTYKAPPPELLEFQKKYGLSDLREYAIKAVYNSDTYVSDSVVQTATAKNIDLDGVYDVLQPFAGSWSSMWKHIISLIASYRDIGKDITVTHAFPKDFKMKPLSMLLLDLKAANDSGAPSYVKQSISHDLAKKVYIDQPGDLLKIQVKEKFYPFNGKSENEINYILSNGIVSNFDKTLYAKFDNIFLEIEQEQPDSVDFYQMEFKKQKELIIKKVKEYISVIDNESADARATAFSAAGTGNQLTEEQILNMGGGVNLNGKLPLAIQQLALARTRAEDSGDQALSKQIGDKIDELLTKI
jgi:hypothetical protein